MIIMAKKTNGLSRDLIIHPGETLFEVIDDRNMTQKELAVRTGVTEKHVSTIINGTKPISVAYAKKLEYALGIEASFWINLQSNYDRELLEFEEINKISTDEIEILKKLKTILKYFEQLRFLGPDGNEATKVLDLRKLLGISDLAAIPNVTYNAAYRVQIASPADVYVMFAWQRICELLTDDIQIADTLDTKKLRGKLSEIKKIMFLEADEMQKELKRIFAECGIAFEIVKHFTGAPVQGFIKNTDQGRMILCLTIRQAYADRFWFTLFHEIAHILNGDVKQRFIDFENVENEMEERADKFARDFMIVNGEYREFLRINDFSLQSIKKFAKSQKVQPYIVIGRLKKEKKIDWNQFSGEMTRFIWAEE